MSRPCPREPVRDLTDRQAEMLESMIGFLLAEHRLPNYRELADLMGGTSTAGAFDLCNTLITKGYLAKSGRHLRVARGVDGVPFALAATGGNA